MSPRQANKPPRESTNATVTVRHERARRYMRYQHKFVSYREISDHLENLSDDYPANIHLVPIGESRGGRNIFLAVVAQNILQPRLSTLVEAGCNGSELYTVSSALALIDHLVKDKNALAVMDYYIVPCLNPDAYECAVKTIKEQSACKKKQGRKARLQRGAKMDLSNGFPYLSVQKPKMYDPEILALYRVLETFKDRIRMYISLREGGRGILYPWGYSSRPAMDDADLKMVALSGQKRGAKSLAVGTVAGKMKITRGTVVDYVKFFHDEIKFVYSVHIEDGRNKDRKDILRRCDEVRKIVKGMSTAVFKFYLRQRGHLVTSQTVLAM